MVSSYSSKYEQDLLKRVHNTIDYLNNTPVDSARLHTRSFFMLLSEVKHYPALSRAFVELVTALHPRPLQWGAATTWRGFIEEAVARTTPDDHIDRAILHSGLRDISEIQGDFENGIRYAQLILADETLNIAYRGSALRYLFRNLRSLGREEEAVDLLKEHEKKLLPKKSQIFKDSVSKQAYLDIKQCALDQLRSQGKVESALEMADTLYTIAITGKRERPELLGDLLTRKSTLEWALSYYPQALADVHRAIAAYQEAGDHFQIESLQSNLGLINWSMGNLVEAETHMLRAIRYFKSAGLKQLLAIDKGNLGLVYLARGNIDRAEEMLNIQQDIARTINFISELERASTNLAVVYYYRNDYLRSLKTFEEAHANFPTTGSKASRFLDSVWISLDHLKLGHPDKGLALLNAAWAEYDNSQLNQDCVYRRTLSMFLPNEERAPLLLKCLERARQSHAQLEEAACLLQLAQLDNSPISRNVHWQAGNRILQTIGADTWTEGRTPEDPPFLPFCL